MMIAIFKFGQTYQLDIGLKSCGVSLILEQAREFV